MTAAAPALRTSLLRDGRLAILAGMTILAVLAIGLLPTLLREQTRDWIAYEQAADRLVAGAPLYDFDLTTTDEEYYLYPPPAAAIWSVAPSAEGLLALKILALVMVGSLAVVAWPSASQRDRGLLAATLSAAAMIAVPNLHDLILGNVMALYVGAVAISLARPGWLGAVPLGLVCAAALKPVIGPYLVWLAIRRRRDALRIAVVGLTLSAVVAVLVGPGRYAEYFAALPQMSVLVDLPSGNVGLSAVSRELALVGVVAAYAVVVVGAVRLDPRRSAAVAIAAGLIAQPSIGFNYAGLLLPAVVILWSADRLAGFLGVVVVPLLVIWSPPAAAVAVMVLAWVRLAGRPQAPPMPSGAVA